MIRLFAIFLVWMLTVGSSVAQTCPSQPKEVETDWVTETKTSIGKVGPLVGGDVKANVKSVTQDLLQKIPERGRLYMEQMMFASFCSAIASDAALTGAKKAKLIQEYRAAVQGESSSTKSGPNTRKKNKGNKVDKTNIDDPGAAVATSPLILQVQAGQSQECGSIRSRYAMAMTNFNAAAPPTSGYPIKFVLRGLRQEAVSLSQRGFKCELPKYDIGNILNPLESLHIIIKTGNDDARKSSDVLAFVQAQISPDTIEEVGAKSLGGGRGNGTTATSTLKLRPGLFLDQLRTFRIHFEPGKDSPLDTDDNWNMQEITVGYVLADKTSGILIQRAGAPLRRFKGGDQDKDWEVVFPK
jgi:hypothetical protein